MSSLLPHFPAPPSAPSAVRSQGSEARGARTFQAHPHRQALLEAAEGTALALRLVDLAALALGARVVLVVLHSALEEALQERVVSAGAVGPSAQSAPGLRRALRALAARLQTHRSRAHLAALAREQPVVVSGHLVPTHWAQLIQVLVVRIVHARGVRLRREERVTEGRRRVATADLARRISHPVAAAPTAPAAVPLAASR